MHWKKKSKFVWSCHRGGGGLKTSDKVWSFMVFFLNLSLREEKKIRLCLKFRETSPLYCNFRHVLIFLKLHFFTLNDVKQKNHFNIWPYLVHQTYQGDFHNIYFLVFFIFIIFILCTYNWTLGPLCYWWEGKFISILNTRKYGGLWPPTYSSCRGLVAFGHLEGPLGPP